MTTMPRMSTRVEQDQQQLHDRSMGEVLSDLSTHAQGLLRGELLLAKRELRDNAKRQAKAIGACAAGAVLGIVALILLGHFIAQALAQADIVELWGGYLIAALIYGGVAAILVLRAIAWFKESSVVPTNTIDQAQEDLQWIQAHR
jgi:hypothetical protein